MLTPHQNIQTVPSPLAQSASVDTNTTSETALASSCGITAHLLDAEEMPRAALSRQTVKKSVPTGTNRTDAPASLTPKSINVRDAENSLTVLSNALLQRRERASTPLHAETWRDANTPENLRAKFRATKTLVVILEIV